MYCEIGTLTPNHASLYDACARRIYTHSGSMDHDQRMSPIPLSAKVKLIMQQGLFWVRLGIFFQSFDPMTDRGIQVHLDGIVSGNAVPFC